MKRGALWWARLPDPLGSEPGGRRPICIIQANAFNASGINTVIALAVTKNPALAAAPGNVLLRTSQSGLKLDSVCNVSQVITVDKRFLAEKIAMLPSDIMDQVDKGLRLVLGLT